MPARPLVRIIPLCCTAILALAACAQLDTPLDESASLSRDEVRRLSGKSDSGRDLCERFGWYGDGICDPFCPQPDPDCDEVVDFCDEAGWYGDGFCDRWCPEPDPDCDRGGRHECHNDSDCEGGYCDRDRGPEPNACVVPQCDDGSLLICLMVQPRCPEGQVSAVRNGCYACVDPRTCEDDGSSEPVPEPDEPTCETDADCENGYCEQYATCMAIGCPPAPPSQCVVPDCDDGTAPVCELLLETCPEGQTVAVRDGCFECVDARTCEPVPADPCEGARVDGDRHCVGPDGQFMDTACCLESACESDDDCMVGQSCDGEVCTDCRLDGCGDGSYCTYCWVGFACIPEGAVC